MIQTCPSCLNELPERGFHCPACGILARCKTCRETLLLNARFCINCGTAAGENSSSPIDGSEEKTTGPAYNIIEFEEDTKSRRFRAKVTDRAIDSVSDPLTLFLARRMEVQLKRSRRHPLDSGTDTDDLQLDLPGMTAETIDEDNLKGSNTAEPTSRHALPPNTKTEQLKEIFRSTKDNKLKLANSRLKQSNQSDFVERLSVLFLLAHELSGRETVPRSELNEVLADVKVYDGNARKWIANTDLLIRDGNSIGLSLPGQERAGEALQQMLDPSIETKWLLGSRSNVRKSKMGAKEEESAEQTEGKVSRGRRAKGTSYFALVRRLGNEGFLKKGRTGEEVKTELERQGHKFALSRVNDALLKLTKSEVLSRHKNESGSWIYQNKQMS